ncbi:MAG: DUF4386 family protein [Anaerolineales bacterium]|nr:DUF4386 family protein [Anaerolineales bacterium]
MRLGSFGRLTAVLAMLAGVCALLSLVVGLAGVNYDFDVFSDSSSLIAAGATAARFIRWSYWLNMVGNYLFMLPLALLLYQWTKPAQPEYARLFTACGFIYILLGAAGSAILAATWPVLMERYAGETAVNQPILAANFLLVTAIAEGGLHGVVQNLAGSVWFGGMGSLLRSKRRGLGVFAVVIGVFLLLNTLGNLFNVEALSLVGLMANIVLGPVWTIWFGVVLLKN